MKYKYYVTYSSVETEVFPLGFDKLKITAEAQEGRIFERRMLDGKLIFINADYAFFKAIDDDQTGKCSEISLRIDQSCDNGITYNPYWYGYFSTTDGEFDIDRCIFSVESDPDDNYRCFIEGLKTEIGFNEISDRIETSGFVPDVNYEFHVCRDIDSNCSPLPDPSPLTTWLIFHTQITGDVTTTIYYREVAVIACEDGSPISPPTSTDLWYPVTDGQPSCIDQGLSKWVRKPQTVVSYNPNPDVQDGICDNGTPRQAKVIYVTKQNTTPAPIIRGYDQVPAANCPNLFYYVDNNPGSTYLWSVTGDLAIVGSATNYFVEIDPVTAGSGTVRCVETSSCGASPMSSQSVAIGSAARYNSSTRIIGRTQACPGSKGYYYISPKQNTPTLNIGGGSSAGGSVADLGGGLFEVTFGTVGSEFVNMNGLGVCDTALLSSLQITVSESARLTPIEGLTTVCKSHQTKYFVPVNDTSSLYTWIITGGTITAGQGTNEITVTWDGTTGYGTIAVYDAAECGCNWLQIADCGYNGEPPFYLCRDNSVIFSINYLLENAINSIKDKICSSIGNVRSDFFQWDAVGDTPGYISGINYVTQNTNKIKYTTIVPTFDILHLAEIIAGSKSFDTKEKISWERIEDILWSVFECYWFIENGYVRVEHYSWFQRTVKFDLTVGNYLKYIKGKNIYSYDKIQAPKFERFKWQQALNTDFVGAEISYSGTCVNRDPLTNVKQRGALYITTDIIYLLSGDTEISDGGITLMVNEYDGSKYTLMEEAGLITGVSYPNAHLSWANLHYNYFRHGRVLLVGRMNIKDEVFLSSIRYKKQEGVKFPFCCSDSLDPISDLVETSVGEGTVMKYEINLKDDTITVDLAHDI